MMALAEDGDVYGWGYNQYDQLCVPNDTTIPANPPNANVVITPIDLSQESNFPSSVTMMAGASITPTTTSRRPTRSIRVAPTPTVTWGTT